MLPPAGSIRTWLKTARVWICAGRGQVEAAVLLCRDTLSTAGEPIRTLLQESLKRIERGEPLPPYEDFVALFARSCLRKSSIV